ncbi:hypothetical protein PoB_007010400 [Plakobranchus ocellatus]|uniref:Uncharacterized protein n=1 Tax=Plakobranchus ocellatus TaxID=259542 RepID=A0AAV4DHF0_9GAST|nr:hypothetical protein PoB_007010400 [Plakobranchus ocellatus]
MAQGLVILAFYTRCSTWTFDGYASEISQVVDRTFSNSPRTAVSVKEILTPRSPGLFTGREVPVPKANENSKTPRRAEHPLTPITPRRLGSQPVSVVYHPTVNRVNANNMSLSSSSSWPELTSLEQEHLHRQLQNHLQQQQRRFSDLGISPATPRSGSTDLPPYNSSRVASNTPRTPRPLASIKEQAGSNLSLDELRNFKLYERSLPFPSQRNNMSDPSAKEPGTLSGSNSFRDFKASFGPNPFNAHGDMGSGLAGFDNFASLTASGPGERRENGVHVPYLNLPLTSRSNTLKTGELLSALLSGYQTSSTNASTLYNSQGPGAYPSGVLDIQGKMHEDTHYSTGREKDAGERKNSEGWTRRDKMLLIGLICVALIVILLAVIVLLVAVGVVKEDGDNSESTPAVIPPSSVVEQSSGTGDAVSVVDIPVDQSNTTALVSTSFDLPLTTPGTKNEQTSAATTASKTSKASSLSSMLPQSSATPVTSFTLPRTSPTTSTTVAIATRERPSTNTSPTTSRQSTTKETVSSTTAAAATILHTQTTTPIITIITTTTERATAAITKAKITAPTTIAKTTAAAATTTTTTRATTSSTTSTTSENPLARLVYASCGTPKCQTFSETLTVI